MMRHALQLHQTQPGKQQQTAHLQQQQQPH
jgi:hypothetical protein